MLRKGVTDAWVSGPHAELAEAMPLEQHFSALSNLEVPGDIGTPMGETTAKAQLLSSAQTDTAPSPP